MEGSGNMRTRGAGGYLLCIEFRSGGFVVGCAGIVRPVFIVGGIVIFMGFSVILLFVGFCSSWIDGVIGFLCSVLCMCRVCRRLSAFGSVVAVTVVYVVGFW